jgi:hypothetical protein
VTQPKRPDFSGHWRLNPEASTLSRLVAAAVQSGELRIEDSDPKFKCQMTIVLGGKPIEKAFEMLSDGIAVTGTDEATGMMSVLRWDGEALVAEWQIGLPTGEMAMSWRYSLEERGRRLVAAEQMRGGGSDQDNVWVFERA